jgi:hypothetical protein
MYIVVPCQLILPIVVSSITGFSDFVHCSDSKQLEEKHDVSETGSVSVLR